MNERDWKVYLTVKQKIRVTVRADNEDAAWDRAESITRAADGFQVMAGTYILKTVSVDCDSVEEDV